MLSFTGTLSLSVTVSLQEPSPSVLHLVYRNPPLSVTVSLQEPSPSALHLVYRNPLPQRYI